MSYTKQDIINFVINIDNFSKCSFLRMQEINGYPESNYPYEYLEILDGYQRSFYINKDGDVEEDYEIDDDDEKSELINFDNHDTLFTSFKAFHEWNVECIMKLSEEEALFVKSLCYKILNKNLDIFLSVSWYATSIYFNKKGQLIIMHPR